MLFISFRDGSKRSDYVNREVLLPERQAGRMTDRGMSSSTKMGQFTYFSLQVAEPVWRGKNVPGFRRQHRQYVEGSELNDRPRTVHWCLDVAKESIEKGKAAYPNSHWLFYNRYCFFFNPQGVPNLALPNLDQAFDFISRSIPSLRTQHRTDMRQLVKQLEGLLATGGTLAFTFIDPHYYSMAGTLLRRQLSVAIGSRETIGRKSVAESSISTCRDLTRRAQDADWLLLVNSNDL